MLRMLICVAGLLSLSAVVAAENSARIEAVWSADAKRELRADIEQGRQKPEFILPEVRIYDSAGTLVLRALGEGAQIQRLQKAVASAAQNNRVDAPRLQARIAAYATRTGQELVLPPVQPGSVVIVQHWANWCAACKPVSKLFDALMRQANAPQIYLVHVESDYPAMLRAEIVAR
jgi:hypothetical protein